jgi:hypothetical protein
MSAGPPCCVISLVMQPFLLFFSSFSIWNTLMGTSILSMPWAVAQVWSILYRKYFCSPMEPSVWLWSLPNFVTQYLYLKTFKKITICSFVLSTSSPIITSTSSIKELVFVVLNVSYGCYELNALLFILQILISYQFPNVWHHPNCVYVASVCLVCILCFLQYISLEFALCRLALVLAFVFYCLCVVFPCTLPIGSWSRQRVLVSVIMCKPTRSFFRKETGLILNSLGSILVTLSEFLGSQ